MNYVYGIILAGGIGARMNTKEPKQFLQIQDKSILSFSIRAFKEWGYCKSVIVVSHIDFIQEVEKISEGLLDENDRIIEGGNTRHESTLNAINSISLTSHDVLIFHDAARPFITRSELENTVKEADSHGVASTAEKSTDTVVMEKDLSVQEVLNRDHVFKIKTPQAIRSDVLKKLMGLKLKSDPTDLSSWALEAGVHTKLVNANPYNIKVTNPSDLQLAEMYAEFLDALQQKG